MKTSKTLRIIIAATLALVTVSVSILYIICRLSDKAYNEKWKDYIDCGLA